MHRSFTMVLVLLCHSIFLQAQNCESYNRLVKEALTARNNQDFETTIKKYNLAILNCPDSVKTVQQELITTFNEIESLKNKAESEREKADNALNVLKKEQAKNKKIIDAFYFMKIGLL